MMHPLIAVLYSFVAQSLPVTARCDLARGIAPGVDLVAGSILGLTTFASTILVAMVAGLLILVFTKFGRGLISKIGTFVGIAIALFWFLGPLTNIFIPSVC
jgi:hypothetical protein